MSPVLLSILSIIGILIISILFIILLSKNQFLALIILGIFALIVVLISAYYNFLDYFTNY